MMRWIIQIFTAKIERELLLFKLETKEKIMELEKQIAQLSNHQFNQPIQISGFDKTETIERPSLKEQYYEEKSKPPEKREPEYWGIQKTEE